MIIAATITLAACAPLPIRADIRGSVTLFGDSVNISDQGGGRCEGNGGFSDIHEGANISIFSASHELLGVGRLEAGHGDTSGYSAYCTFPFSISAPIRDLYQIEIGNRDAYNFTGDEAGDLRLSLGD